MHPDSRAGRTPRTGPGVRRRRLLRGLATLSLAGGSAPLWVPGALGEATRPPLLRPPRLVPGDRVGLVNPATARHDVIPTEIMADAVAALGLRPKRGANYYARWGNLAGTDAQRVADIHAFFADPDIKAIWATGGWGSARLLPALDYDLIRDNPKVVVGYSDATALLNGIHARTGLVTFHGPFPVNRRSAEFQRAMLFDGESATLRNPREIAEDETVVTEHRIRTIRPGKARGPLLGGNLTVLSAIVGSAYLPRFDGAILFLEDVNEALYRIDRMLTQLQLAGVLERIAGFVFGHCSDCDPGTRYGSMTLEEIIRDHIEPLRIPAWMGAMVGHIPGQFTLPLGVDAQVDAAAGELRVGPAVR